MSEPFATRRLYLLGATTLTALTIYLLTIAPDITWAHFGMDGGELITASITNGIPHPSGYPTYTLLGNLFSYLPISTIAYRYNLFSAICIALTAGIITVQPSITNYQLSIAAGLTFAFFPFVWSQAIITEVYGLNLLMVGLCLWALGGQRPLLATFFLALAITTHLTSLFLIPLVLLRLRHKQWIKLIGSFALGLTPFLMLPLLAQSDSPVVWSDPTTLSGWWWLISGQIYRPNMLAFPPNQWLTRLGEWHRAGLWQLWLILLILILGFALPRIAAAKSKNTAGQKPPFFTFHISQFTTNPLLYGLIAIVYFLYAFTYNTPDAIVLTLPAILILCTQLPTGFTTISKFLPSDQATWLALLLPLLLLLLNFKALSLHHDTSIRPQAEQLLQKAYPQAILLTPGDATIFTLWYYHHVEGQRPDIVLVDANLFAFDWYRQRLARLHPDLAGLAVDDLVRFEQMNNGQRPLCHTNLNSTPTITCQPAKTKD